MLSGDTDIKNIMPEFFCISEGEECINVLDKSNRRLHDISKIISEGLWETDNLFRVVYASELCLDMLGVSSEELIGKRFSEIGSFEYDDSGSDIDWKTLQKNKVYIMETDRNAKTVFVINSIPVFNLETKTFEGVRGTVKKIESKISDVILEKTEYEYKRAEAKLNKKLKMLDAMHFSEGVFIKERDWNKSVRKVISHIGKTVEAKYVYVLKNVFDEISGQMFINVHSLWPESDVFSHINTYSDIGFGNMEEAFSKKTPVSGYVSNYSLAEKDIFAKRDSSGFAVAPVFVGNRWWGVIGIETDGADSEVLELGRDTINAVANIFGSTIARAESEMALACARDEAEQANRMKSSFLAAMSHELRTPLNAVIGFSEMMMQEVFGTLEDRYKNYASDIRNSGIYLLEMINDILDLSKIEAGRMDLDEEEVDIVKLLHSSVSMITKDSSKNIEFVKDIPDNLPLLYADERKVKQIVLNLMSNAVKFTEEGNVTVSCGVSEEGMMFISVADTGIGISSEEIGKVFEPFRQVENLLTRKYKGTGLGIALSRKFMQLHGGLIDLESKRGKGTTVTVRFPSDRIVEK